jgi:hypothetical protein
MPIARIYASSKNQEITEVPFLNMKRKPDKRIRREF